MNEITKITLIYFGQLKCVDGKAIQPIHFPKCVENALIQ